MARIIIIDDEASIRRTLKEILSFEKYIVDEAIDGAYGLEMVKLNDYQAVLLDIKMPRMDGLEAFHKIKEIKPHIPIIMISGHADIETAVEFVKKGAFDFISKPPDLNKLLQTLKNACTSNKDEVTQDISPKRKPLTHSIQDIIGKSLSIQKIHETINRVAPTDARILITGSNGTGKELVARWMHEKSNRNGSKLIEVNCAAIPTELIESELFGHEKGAFTSAIKQRIGKFEQAHGGTLFLDEIGDMSLSAQAKVLRALQEKKITRVGGEKDISVDVRVIAATNKNLIQEISENKFREDLYHRLAVIIVQMPTLNERREDIPLLVDHFNQQICQEYGITEKTFTKEALKILEIYSWKGNIRELRNVVERLIILSKGKVTAADVMDYVQGSPSKTDGKMLELFHRFTNIEDIHQYIHEAYNDFKDTKVAK